MSPGPRAATEGTWANTATSRCRAQRWQRDGEHTTRSSRSERRAYADLLEMILVKTILYGNHILVMALEKSCLLSKFRSYADTVLSQLPASSSKNDKSRIINTKLQAYRDDLILSSFPLGVTNLDDVLLIYYVSYIVMLEYRNKVWPYDYMSFSRRIGEIWEPFCKLPFIYPVNELRLYEPPSFSTIQNQMQKDAINYIDSLKLSDEEKNTLLNHYNKVWSLIDSESINLNLDLHVEYGEIYLDIDYKSGFSSNEKGNTNRLLMVAGIYNIMKGQHETMIFVRQKEDDNNHYLQTLKSSNLWKVYCAHEAYEKIKELSGFDIEQWMNTNMHWDKDISAEFKKYLEENDLMRYLEW